jgi:uncharacterized protein
VFPEHYRNRIHARDLVSFSLVEKETNLRVSATRNLKNKTLQLVTKYRNQLENYIIRRPEFLTSLVPLPITPDTPLIARAMLEAGRKAGVGPMAAIAGAIAEFVGNELVTFSRQVIIENGGDIFLKTLSPRVVGIFAGDSPFSEKIGIEIAPEDTPVGVCTSSGTVGHSFSFGKANAVVIISRSATLSDAAATATGNAVKTVEDIPAGIEVGRNIPGVTGVLIIKGDKMGSWGKVKLCRTG